MNKNFFIEAFKYGIVGILNTLLTAITIWIMMHIFNAPQQKNVPAFVISISNVTGYIVGLINSFIWNRKWTFKSRSAWKKEFLRFFFAFLICYIPQLLLVNFLNDHSCIAPIAFRFFNYSGLVTSAYLCQLTGIVFYTILNFLCNKYYTFKK